MANETVRKNKVYNDDEDEEETQGHTQFEPHESDNSEDMWEVIRILRESKTKYQVEWAGDNPDTGKPWKPTWIAKEDCSNDLIQDWKTQKRRAKEAKELAKNSNQRQRSVASSRTAGTRSSHTVSRRETEESTVASRSPSRRLVPVVEITRKRRRSPQVVEEQPPATASESEAESPDVPRPPKKRRLAESPHIDEDTLASPNVPFREASPTAEQRSVEPSPHVGTSQSKLAQSQESQDIVPDSYEMPYDNFSEQEIEHNLSQPLPEQRSSPHLRPVPPISPTVFREQMEPPLSQIEQFSTPGTSPIKQKRSSANLLDSREGLQPEHEMKDAYEVTVSPSNVYRLKPKNGANAEVNNHSSPQASSTSSHQSLLMDVLPFRLSSAAALRRDMVKKSKHTEEANEAYIAGLQARIAGLEGERGVLEQTLEISARNHAAAKQTLEKEISRLMEGLERIRTAPATAEAFSPPETQISGAIAALPPPYVRSEEDDAIITQLREETAKLQDANAQLRVQKAQSDAMEEQARDIARRAEVARMELARKEKIARETAQNAPKIAEALYKDASSKLEMEVEKLKVQNELLLQQNRLTGDVIRQKAAKTEVLQRKYQKLADEHQQMFDDMEEAENEQEEALHYMQVVKGVITQIIQGPSDSSMLTRLASLLQGGPQEVQENLNEDDEEDEDGEGEEMEENDDEANEDSVMASGSEQQDSQPIVEEGAQSYDGPDLGDPPVILIEEIEEGPLGPASGTPRSTQSDKSDGMAFACLWQQTEETCQEHHTTKEALRDHIFEDHLGNP